GVILNDNMGGAPANGTGTDIDAEDDLGLAADKFEARLALRWRPGRRHELEVGYQFARRTASSMLQRDITFGDSTYQAGANIGSQAKSHHAFFSLRVPV